MFLFHTWTAYWDIRTLHPLFSVVFPYSYRLLAWNVHILGSNVTTLTLFIAENSCILVPDQIFVYCTLSRVTRCGMQNMAVHQVLCEFRINILICDVSSFWEKGQIMCHVFAEHRTRWWTNPSTSQREIHPLIRFWYSLTLLFILNKALFTNHCFEFFFFHITYILSKDFDIKAFKKKVFELVLFVNWEINWKTWRWKLFLF